MLNQIDIKSNELKAKIINSPNMEIGKGRVVYYLSQDGDDNNDGLSINTPWRTIDKVNSMGKKLINAVILFKRGDSFRGNIILFNGITYSAYGKGPKPIIMGSPENGADALKWQLVEGTKNIYKYHALLRDVGSLILNDGESIATKLTPEIIVTETEKGLQYNYNLTYNDLADMEVISVFDPKAASTKLEFKNPTGELYFRCDKGNPGEVFNSIEFNTYGYVFNGAKYYDGCNTDITIDNIHICYTGGHGIGCSSAKNLVVTNCEVDYVGGAVMCYYINKKNITFYRPGRYGNGIEVTGFCDGYFVKNNYIHDIYDAGITHQNGKQLYTNDRHYKDVIYTENLVENCAYSIEYFASNSADNIHINTMRNVEISNNILRNAGSGICEQRVSKNYLGDTRDGKQGINMASHINGWYSCDNISQNFVIKNNIFDRVIRNKGERIRSGIIIISAKKEKDLPKMEGNTYVHLVDASFAYFGVNNEMFAVNGKMDENIENFIKDIVGDKTANIFVVK